MEIKDAIFEEFFKKLEEDDEFPNRIIEELKKLLKGVETVSKETVFEAIKKGCVDVGANQED